MSHKKHIITICIILLAITTLGVFWYTQKNTNKFVQTEIQEDVQEKKEKTNNEIVYNNDEKIDTSDWQTYRNEEYGFEIKYPEDWEIIKDEEKSDIAKKDGFLADFFLVKKERIIAMNKDVYIKDDADGMIEISIRNKNQYKEKLNKDCNFGLIKSLNFDSTVNHVKSCRYYRQLNIFGHHYFVTNNHVHDWLYKLSVEIDNENIGKKFIENIGNKKNVFPYLTSKEIQSMHHYFIPLDNQMYIGDKIIETFQFLDY